MDYETTCHRGLVWKVVRRYKHLGAEPADLMQEGFMAVLDCQKKYKGFEYKGAKFSTYAAKAIKHRVLRFIFSWQQSRNGVECHRLTKKIKRKMIYVNENRLDAVDVKECRAVMEIIFNTMSYRHREVIKLRFGFNDDWRCYNLQEVGYIFNVSKQRVRDIERTALFNFQSRSLKLMIFTEPPWSNTIPQKQTEPIKSATMAMKQYQSNGS